MSDCLTRLSHLASRACLHVNARKQPLRQTPRQARTVASEIGAADVQ
jgi:hypothetical protein